MAKMMTTVRISDETKNRLNAYNNIRESYGFRRYSMADCVEQCIDLWIKSDKEKMKELAQSLQDDLNRLD